MIRDDWMMRQIKQLAQALAGIAADVHAEANPQGSNDDLDGLARNLTGMGLSTVDRLPVVALAASVSGDEVKREILIGLLRVAAEQAQKTGNTTLAAQRVEKASALEALA